MNSGSYERGNAQQKTISPMQAATIVSNTRCEALSVVKDLAASREAKRSKAKQSESSHRLEFSKLSEDFHGEVPTSETKVICNDKYLVVVYGTDRCALGHVVYAMKNPNTMGIRTTRMIVYKHSEGYLETYRPSIGGRDCVLIGNWLIDMSNTILVCTDLRILLSDQNCESVKMLPIKSATLDEISSKQSRIVAVNSTHALGIIFGDDEKPATAWLVVHSVVNDLCIASDEFGAIFLRGCELLIWSLHERKLSGYNPENMLIMSSGAKHSEKLTASYRHPYIIVRYREYLGALIINIGKDTCSPIHMRFGAATCLFLQTRIAVRNDDGKWFIVGKDGEEGEVCVPEIFSSLVRVFSIGFNAVVGITREGAMHTWRTRIQ